MSFRTVGCIYASKPFNSSLIYDQHLFPLQFYYQRSKKQLRYISSIFLVFLLTLFSCHLYFLCYLSYKGLFHLLPPWPLILGQGSTYQHTGSTWRFGRPMAKVLKCRVSRYVYTILHYITTHHNCYSCDKSLIVPCDSTAT